MLLPAGPVPSPLGPLRCRPQTDDDQDLVASLFASTRDAELAQAGLDPRRRADLVALQQRARDTQRRATHPDAELGIVELDGIAVGEIDLALAADGDAEVVEVLELVLVPGLRGHGLGTAVLGAVLADADRAGRATVLAVDETNPAGRLYARLGFTPVAREGVHVRMARPAGGGGPGPGGDPGPRVAPGPPDTASPDTGTAAGPADPPSEVVAAVDLGAVDDAVLRTEVRFADLAPHVGARVRREPDGPDLVLEAVEPARRSAPGRQAFSLVLRGPAAPALEHGAHLLALPGTGPAAVFLVPLAPTDGERRYQAVYT